MLFKGLSLSSPVDETQEPAGVSDPPKKHSGGFAFLESFSDFGDYGDDHRAPLQPLVDEGGNPIVKI